MRRPRVRFTVRRMMVMIAVMAVSLFSYLEWDKRYGPWSPGRDSTRWMLGYAIGDRRTAKEIRGCPRDHTPEKTRSACMVCFEFGYQFPRSMRTRSVDPGRDADPAKIRREFVAMHDEIAREFEQEAATYTKIRQKYLAPVKVKLTPKEQSLIFGETVRENYDRRQL